MIKFLQLNNFETVEKNSEIMKLRIGGFFELDFVSKEKMVID